jgi:type II secretory pathway component PulF
MPNFTYVVRQQSGAITRSTSFAQSPARLRATLEASGGQLISCSVAGESKAAAGTLTESLNPLQFLPPRSRDIELALRQLAMMLRSGLDLLSALESIKSQTTSAGMTRVLRSLTAALQSGQGLSAAMSRFAAFPPIAVQLVAVGEETGNLSRVLEQAAKHMAQRRTTLSEVRIALAYPAIVATAAVSIAVYLIFAVIPELQKFLNAMGRKLPRMTQTLVDMAQWCQLNGTTSLLCMVAVVTALMLLTQWPPARMLMDRWCLRLPVIGSILRLSGTATFASSLSVMIRSGIKLVEALSIAQRLQSNRFLASRVLSAREAVLRGEGLAEPLATRHAYVPMLTSMIDVAQRTGQLDTTLEDVSKFCEVELQGKIKRLSVLLEPAIIIVAGGIVGYVYMAFFMALMSAGGNMR